MHYGLIMQSPCKALNGGYSIFEVVSSGLTHTTADYVHFMPEWSHFFIQPFYTLDMPYAGINYGLIKISAKSKNGKKNLNASFIVKD